MTRTYQEPTLFGAIYASRLIREIDIRYGYHRFRAKTRGKLDIRVHSDLLLKWLNTWNSRVEKASFPTKALGRWQDKWQSVLPRRKLASLWNNDLDVLAHAYGALDDIYDIGATIASKILFAVCPQAAMMWDAPIQRAFQLRPSPDGYSELLGRSRREAAALIAATKRCGDTEQGAGNPEGSPRSNAGKSSRRLSLDHDHQGPRDPLSQGRAAVAQVDCLTGRFVHAGTAFL